VLRNREYEQEEEESENIVIYQSQDRIQELRHLISSLEKPTLENVEALMVRNEGLIFLNEYCLLESSEREIESNREKV